MIGIAILIVLVLVALSRADKNGEDITDINDYEF